MSKVLVTGACGFLGTHLVEEFIAAGYDLKATDLPDMDSDFVTGLGAEFIPSDVTDIDSLRKVVKGCDIVVHNAGIFDFSASRELLFDVNCGGVHNMAKASLEAGLKRFIIISSVAVYGSPAYIPIDEEHPKAPSNNYGLSKYAGELAAFKYYHENGLPVTSLRPTLIYGPRSTYGHACFLALAQLVKWRLKRLPLLGIKGGFYAHAVHAEDVARAAVLVAQNDRAIGGAYNLVDDTPLTVEQYLQSLIEPFGLSPLFKFPIFKPIWRGCAAMLVKHSRWAINLLNRRLQHLFDRMCQQFELRTPLRPRLDIEYIDYSRQDMIFSNQRLKKLGFKFNYPDFRTGIAETVQWYKDNGWLVR